MKMKLTTEIVFAQRLADNEPSVRNKAIKKLTKYISAKSASENGFTDRDLARTCKGLFYCMWMSDKPLVQQELAKSMSKLIHNFHKWTDGLRFADAFFKTFAREWHGIDFWRVDKFQTLVRELLRETLHLVRVQKWSKDAVSRFTKLLTRRLVLSEDVPHGFLLHMSDIYIDELARVALDKVKGTTLTILLKPFCRLLVQTKNQALFTTLSTRVFEYCIRLCDPDDDDEDEELDPAEFAEEKEDLQAYGKIAWEEVLMQREMKAMEVPHPKFDYLSIANQLRQLVLASKCVKKTRFRINNICKKLESIAEGEYPLDVVNVTDESDLDEDDVEEAAQRLLEDEEKQRRETQKHRLEMKRLRKENGKKITEKDEDSNSGDESSKKKPKYKFHIMQMYSGNSDPEDLEGEVEESTPAPTKRKKSKKVAKLQVNGVKKNVKTCGEKFTNEGNSKPQNTTTSAHKLQTDVQITTNIINEIPETGKNVCEVKNAFAHFPKAPTVPKATVRGIASANSKRDKLNATKLEVLKAIQDIQVKKVNFALAKNVSQGPNEYMLSVRSSPDVPFDAKKMPGHCVLKSSCREKRKRSSAMDFF